jgi:hypothetical protein
VSLS